MPVGFVTAGAYIWLARPVKLSILIGSGVIIAGLEIRALASGHVRKNEVLTDTGLYAHTRNPLYFGSLVLAAGFVLGAIISPPDAVAATAVAERLKVLYGNDARMTIDSREGKGTLVRLRLPVLESRDSAAFPYYDVRSSTAR